MKATFEAGTETVVSSVDLSFQLNWLDEGCVVYRSGPVVTVVIRAKAVEAGAWSAKKWKKGERVTEGGHTYEAIVTETDELKPTEKPTDWKNLGPTPENLELLFTLPPEFRPAVDTPGVRSRITVKSDGKVEGEEVPDLIIYRAAEISP